MSFAETDEVIWRRDFLFGINDGVDAERGQQSLPFVAAAARLRRLMLNCKLRDRVKFIEGLLDSMLLEDDVLCNGLEISASAAVIDSSSFSSIGAILVSVSEILRLRCSCSCGDDDTKHPILDLFVRGCRLIFGNERDGSDLRFLVSFSLPKFSQSKKGRFVKLGRYVASEATVL